MKTLHKIMSAVLVSLASSTFTWGAEDTLANTSAAEAPVTPRTSALRTFLGEVATEKYDLSFKHQSATDIQAERRILKTTNPANENSLVGLFPPSTKLTEALSFIGEVASGSTQYPMSISQTAEASHEAVSPTSEAETSLGTPSAKIMRIVSDEANKRFLIVNFMLPSSSEPTPPQASSETKPEEKDHYAILLERLEEFLKKASIDAGVQGKRLEVFVKDEVRPTIEQEARNTGKALEAAGRNVGKLFGRKKK